MMDNREMEKLNTDNLDQAAGGSFVEDAVNAVSSAVGYVKHQFDLRDARENNTNKLREAAVKNGIEEPSECENYAQRTMDKTVH